jgi:hypothetical protein
MSLAWNTEQLLDAAAGKPVPGHTAIEYHLLSWRELYDKSIISADRHHSSAGEWVLRGDRHFYTVTVTSRPFYSIPQHLCLSFDCFTKTESERNWTATGPPIDKVATELITLLSVFAREPLLPLGLRRQDDRPITIPYHYTPPPRTTGAVSPPPMGIDSPGFITIVKGFAKVPAARQEAIIAAARFYYGALLLTGFDIAGAYVSLVCAIECLAGHHFGDKKFEFDEVEKFKKLKAILENISSLRRGKALAEKLKQELVAAEYFLFQKYKNFIVEHLPESFWSVPDALYPYNSIFPPIPKEKLVGCLRDAYDARSSYVHAGKPFAPYVEFGMRDRSPIEVSFAIEKIRRKQRYLPPLSWLERLTQMVIIEYLHCSCAPELVTARQAEFSEKERLLATMKELPEDVMNALEKLTKWTAGYLGFSVINPMAPNKQWADKIKTVTLLREKDLIGGKGKGMQGHSWLKDRFVGEVVGEHFFGVAKNPFRDNELLLPKGMHE